MKKYLFWLIFLFLIILPLNSQATDVSTPVDSLIKGSLSTIYYYASDGYRYVFPNSRTFGSWFTDYSSVATTTNEELYKMPLKGNVTYRPGVRMVKITTNPKVYAVDQGGVLRWIETEELAQQLYGQDWNKKIDDIPDSFFVNYIEGDPIENVEDYLPATALAETTTINKNKGIAESSSAVEANTEVGGDTEPTISAQPTATSAEPTVTEAPTTSATSTPETATSTPDTSTATSTADDATPPVISNTQAIAIADTSVTIAWTTDESANSKVYLSEIFPVSTDTTLAGIELNYVTNHNITIKNLSANTTYYYLIVSADSSGNITTSSGQSFTTLAPSLSIVGFISDANQLVSAYSVTVSGNYAYVVARAVNRLTVVDISNPCLSTIVGSVQDNIKLKYAHSVAVSGNYAYVTSLRSNCLTVVDISNPASPTIIGSLQDDTYLKGAIDATVSGNYAYVAARASNSFTVVDISNPASSTIVGSVQDDTELNYAYSVAVSGNYAYVAAYMNDSLVIIDISNPALPAIVGSVQDSTKLDTAYSVAVFGNYAYVVTGYNDSLVVVDISNPASPAIVGSVQDNTNLSGAYSVYVSGNYAYVAAGNNDTLTVVNIFNPVSPTIVASVKDNIKLDQSESVYVSGNYAYVASLNSNSLSIIDISSYTVNVLGIEFPNNPLNLQPGWLINNKKYAEVFYVNDSLCLQWIINEQVAEKYFGRIWNQNIKEFEEIPRGYKFCGNLE